ncbi:hypothetical protein JL722_1060 [Aureococcus anophagefferens]|nr:hypothetical protein JL722_1060 [Aureococcus anophagefferens]
MVMRAHNKVYAAGDAPLLLDVVQQPGVTCEAVAAAAARNGDDAVDAYGATALHLICANERATPALLRAVAAALPEASVRAKTTASHPKLGGKYNGAGSTAFTALVRTALRRPRCSLHAADDGLISMRTDNGTTVYHDLMLTPRPDDAERAALFECIHELAPDLVRVTHNWDYTPLHQICWCCGLFDGTRPETIEALYGLDPAALRRRDCDGRTPLQSIYEKRAPLRCLRAVAALEPDRGGPRPHGAPPRGVALDHACAVDLLRDVVDSVNARPGAVVVIVFDQLCNAALCVFYAVAAYDLRAAAPARRRLAVSSAVVAVVAAYQALREEMMMKMYAILLGEFDEAQYVNDWAFVMFVARSRVLFVRSRLELAAGLVAVFPRRFLRDAGLGQARGDMLRLLWGPSSRRAGGAGARGGVRVPRREARLRRGRLGAARVLVHGLPARGGALGPRAAALGACAATRPWTNPERLLATPDPSRDADEWLGRLGEIERALRRRGEAVDAALEAQSAGLRGRLEEKLEALESKLYKLDATNHALESKLDAVLARLADQGKRPREGDHG